MIRIERIHNALYKYIIINAEVPGVSKINEQKIISLFFGNIFNGWGFSLIFTTIDVSEETSTRIVMTRIRGEQYCLTIPEKQKELLLDYKHYGLDDGNLARKDQQKIINFLFDPD